MVGHGTLPKTAPSALPLSGQPGILLGHGNWKDWTAVIFSVSPLVQSHVQGSGLWVPQNGSFMRRYALANRLNTSPKCWRCSSQVLGLAVDG